MGRVIYAKIKLCKFIRFARLCSAVWTSETVKQNDKPPVKDWWDFLCF